MRAIAESWFITEPLLFGVWTTHRLVVTGESPSLRTGRGRIEIHPAFASALSDAQLGQVLRLEVLRVALSHPYLRRRPWMGHAWRASNITLAEHAKSTLPLPRAAQVFGTHDLDGQYFELYYDELARGGRPDSGSGDSSDTAGGGAQTGGAEPGDPGAAAIKAHLADADGGGTALWDQDELVAETLRDAVLRAESTQSWGTIAGSLRAAIRAGVAPKLDYRAILREFRRSILSSRRYLTRMWPNRRYDFDAMGSRRELSTRLLVAVDVSGSISGEDAGRALATINQLFRYGVEAVDVVWFDTEVHTPAVALSKARAELVIVGGGGTDFQPVLSYLDVETGYDGLIVLTDGVAQKPNPPRNRRTRIVWLLNSQSSYERSEPMLRSLGRCAYMRVGAG